MHGGRVSVVMHLHHTPMVSGVWRSRHRIYTKLKLSPLSVFNTTRKMDSYKNSVITDAGAEQQHISLERIALKGWNVSLTAKTSGRGFHPDSRSFPPEFARGKDR